MTLAWELDPPVPAPGGCRRAGAFALSVRTIGPAGPACQVTWVFPVAHSLNKPCSHAGLRRRRQRRGNAAQASSRDVGVEFLTGHERAATVLVALQLSRAEQIRD